MKSGGQRVRKPKATYVVKTRKPLKKNSVMESDEKMEANEKSEYMSKTYQSDEGGGLGM